jgi:hypothetical protein
MQVQLFVERDQNECIVNLAGTAYKFKRNEHGHLVSEITDQEHIKWVTDPYHNTAFKAYSAPKKKIIEVVDKVVDAAVRMSAHFGNEGSQDAFAPPASQSEPEPEFPPYPKKGSKRPVRRSEPDGNQQNNDRV